MAAKICLSLLFLSTLGSVLSQEILLHPYSRLVPIWTDVSFTCKLRNAQHPYWMVNTIEANTKFHEDSLSSRGIYILNNEQSSGITTLALRVNSSYDVNNTRIVCRADRIRSRTANLLTINRKYWINRLNFLVWHSAYYTPLMSCRFSTVTKSFPVAKEFNSHIASVVISISLARVLSTVV